MYDDIYYRKQTRFIIKLNNGTVKGHHLSLLSDLGNFKHEGQGHTAVCQWERPQTATVCIVLTQTHCLSKGYAL